MKINYTQLIATCFAAMCSVVALGFQLFGVEGQGFVTALIAALFALCLYDKRDFKIISKKIRRRIAKITLKNQLKK
ncbi:MAG: hypothetical protein LBE11_00125 [Prevotellaceae bacterium]|jgi:hypothetical protein|nr:hypothetical protein [Prevotellaceae bacterium]